ncbi:MAG: ChaN family lipoprotein [Desulfobacteraceae bacterium]|nr:ChaN family lipoprotein [Desulfobacteraceae bacterium]
MTNNSLESLKQGTIVSSETGKPVTFEELLADLKKARIVYVGESHTNSEHHDIQLRIIKALFDDNHNLSVGMEMFDRSYQHILDQWSAGQLDRKTFMRKTHWYANWKYDFELYGGVLDFIKENNIKLAGLNIPFHIPPKISVGGIDNLSDNDRKHLPEKTDTSDAAHRAYVEEIFKQHRIRGRDFEDFYMAQCVWEDIMAESVAFNLKKSKMVVLAGNGHIIRKFGIPDRAFRRTGAAFITIYPAPAGSSAELSYADYIWITSPGLKKIHNP